MGDMPRSRTGLVPCTFRRKQDSFSTWSKLPPQPARELYPYRGDFINARNRKKKEERKAKIDAMKRSVVTSNNIECSSTVAVPPCSPRDSPTKGNVGWNANYKHNSFQLTPDEQQQRAENKNKFTDFLRIEACKRHARASSNDKKKVAVKPPQDETVPKRKPPVPRLSALALARAQGKSNTEINKTKPTSVNRRNVSNCSDISQKTIKPNDSSNVQMEAKSKVGTTYLDFISKKPEKAPEPSKEPTTFPKVDMLKESVSSIQQPVIADDDSIFRLQLERIVKRASDLVVEKQQKATSSCDETTNSSTSSQVSPTEDKQARVPPRGQTESDMRNRHHRLTELEMRIARISGSSTTTEQPSEETSCSGNTHELSCSVGTEVVPRVPMPMHPMNMNVQDLQRRAQWKCLHDHLHSDSSDDSSTNFYSVAASSREQILWQGNENVDAYPSSQLSVVEPSILPRRQFEDEPLPRGHGSFDESTESLGEEDFFSLFG